MKKLPLGIQDFAKLRERNYLYIDKTQHIYNLIDEGEWYFCSRPRRFGKSLLVSTMKELFAGNRKPFKGLWIDTESDYSWTPHPVIHLDLSMVVSESKELMIESLNVCLENNAQLYGISLDNLSRPENKLNHLIKELSTKHRVAVLIDEYDHPLLRNIERPKVAESIRDLLSSFFAQLKAMDSLIEFVFITGVTKFAKTSLFSGMNNINDISLKPLGAELFGYSEREVVDNFDEYIARFAKEKNRSKEGILQEMKEWYDGYQFSELPVRMYNPYSAMYYLNDCKRSNYWFATGTPTFLIQFLQKHVGSLGKLNKCILSDAHLISFEQIKEIPLSTLLYQTGYLTIDTYDESLEVFRLRIPNKEVEQSLTTNIVGILAHSKADEVKTALVYLYESLDNNDIDQFVEVLQNLLANIPYQLHIPQERYYHSLVQFLATLMNIDCAAEVCTSNGRIDLVIKRNKQIFIFEFKFDGTAQQALDQIEQQRYAEKYRSGGMPITSIGISFSFKDKKLTLDTLIKTS